MMNNVKKEFAFDITIQHSGQCMVLAQIIRILKDKKDRIVNVDLSILCNDIENLNMRMAKTVMEIIQDYNVSNPEVFQVMGKYNNVPYSGTYNSNENSTSFDIRKFPSSLIIILNEFIKLNKKHQK